MPEHSSPAIVVGTAQWGLDYGITNATGRISDTSLRELLEVLAQVGVRMLDTAPSYGDAEERIGLLALPVAVQTKASGAADIRASVTESTKRLGRSPERLLLHDWPDLDDSQQRRAARVVEDLRAEGIVHSVGISGYEAADLRMALEAFTRLDVAQMPVSILDQRLVGSPEVSALRAAGGILQARSVYLQGLALTVPGQVPLADHPHLARLRRTCSAAGVSTAEACRAFVLAQEWIDEVVVGVTAAAELLAWQPDASGIDLPWPHLASDDPLLIDPRTWEPTGRAG